MFASQHLVRGLRLVFTLALQKEVASASQRLRVDWGQSGSQQQELSQELAMRLQEQEPTSWPLETMTV